MEILRRFDLPVFELILYQEKYIQLEETKF